MIVLVAKYYFVGVFLEEEQKYGSDTLCGIAPKRNKIGYDTNNLRGKFVKRS